MSHEILAIAGPPGTANRAHRLAALGHGAQQVPGAAFHEVFETPIAAVALVHTDPPGGTSAHAQRLGTTVRVALAVTEAGLQTALTTDRPHAVGAEAGHVLLEAGDETLGLTTDGLAFVPSYWGPTSDGVAVSTHLASLVSLGLSAAVDEQGVAEYLVHMHPWGHRTLLADATLLAPGGRLRWRVGAPVQVHARPLYVPADDAMTDHEAIGRFAELWPRVLQETRDRGGEGRSVLALSGGLDSRAIAAGANSLGWRPTTYTYGSPHHEETRTAMRVAERLGLAQVVIPVVDERLLDRLPRVLDALDGAHSPGEMYESWFSGTLRSFADVIINGMIAGPMWGDDKTMGMTDAATVAAALRARFTSAMRSARPFVHRRAEEALNIRIGRGIDAAIEGWDFGERADVVMFWKQANKMLRWGSMLTNSLRRIGIRLEAPFLDRRFVSFSAQLSPQQRLNGRLYLRVHRQVFAATADIGRSDDGNPPRALNHVYWSGERSITAQMIDLTVHHPVAGLRRGTRRMLDVGAARIRDRTGVSSPADRLDEQRDVFPADVWVRRRPLYAVRLAELLESGLGSGSLLDDDAIEAAAAALRRGEPTAPAHTLARVGAAGYWLNDYRRRAEAVRAAARTV